MLKKIFNLKVKKKIVSVLDIGSSKICCLIAEINQQNEIKILGVGHQVSVGFKSGFITDLREIESCIINAVESAEKAAGVTISKIFVTFSGAGIKSGIVKSSIKLMSGVEESDLSNVVRHAISKVDRDKNEILHYFPIEYRINESNGVTNPMGIYAESLSSTLCFVTIPSGNLFNIVNCLARCHLDVEDIIAAPYSSLYAVLTEEEIEIGVTLIDIGHTTSSYLVFRDNQLIHMGYIPIGGHHITSDIAKVLSTNYQTAERIKILHSRAVSSYSDNHKMIDIPVVGLIDGDNKDIESISCATLNQIVAARIEEIFENLKTKISGVSFEQNLYNRVVLSGGTSQLMDIRVIATKILNAKVRIAKPKVPDGLLKDNRVIFYSSAIGCLEHYIKKKANEEKVDSEVIKPKTLSRKIIDWMKEYI
jgi:cell division protein FtsA